MQNNPLISKDAFYELNDQIAETNVFQDIPQTVMAPLMRMVDAESSVFAAIKRKNDSVEACNFQSLGVDQQCTDAYQNNYQDADPILPMAFDSARQQLMANNRKACSFSLDNIVEQRSFAKGEYYNEFLRPNSLTQVLSLSVPSRRDPNLVYIFGMHRYGKTAFHSNDSANAATLGPTLYRMLSDLEADQQLQEYSLVSAALQQQKTDHGTVILNKDLEVLFANLSGQEHLGIKQQHGLKYLDLDCRLRDALQAQLQQRDDSAKLLPTLQYKNAEVQFSSQFCERAKDLRITLHTRTQNKTETLQERIAALNLTRRETALAELVSQGLTNAQISYKLNISIRTVENHLRSVYAKAGVHNRTSLAYTLTQAH